MICVAANSADSLENINIWKAEISNVEPHKPIMLVLTKKDLLELMDEPGVTWDQVKENKTIHGLQGCSQTSSRDWEDFNVHKAFVQAIATGYFAKYGVTLGGV